MDIDMKSVGQRIKERRMQLGFKQTDLYNMCGITSGALSNIENGLRTPSAIIFHSIAEALECDMNYLMTGESFNQENTKICHSEETPEDAQLLEQFHALDEEDQEEILMMIQLKYNRIQKARKKEQQSSLSDPGNLADEIA